jgi:uncharacterized SAM-binding protein YcdF (DUF218 family)
MKTIVIILLAGVVAVLGLSFYLTPNDLAGCQAHPSDVRPCQPADAIIAVSGGDTPARTHEAVQLYKDGWAPKLIFSGAAKDKTGPSNAETMRRDARAAGVPDRDIITEEYSENTKENAEKVQDIFSRDDISSVILVTSAYHQRRAALEFTARLGGSVSVRSHPVASDNQWSSWWWVTPTGWFLAIGELIRIGMFFVGGGR